MWRQLERAPRESGRLERPSGAEAREHGLAEQQRRAVWGRRLDAPGLGLELDEEQVRKHRVA